MRLKYSFEPDIDSSFAKLTYQREHISQEMSWKSVKENTMKAKCSDSNLRLYICYPRIYSGKVSPRVLIYVESNIWTVDLIFHFPLDSLHIVDITAVS